MAISDTPINQPVRRSALRRGVIAVSLVGGGFILGAGSLAFAAAGGGAGWHGGWHGGWHHGARIGMIQHMVRNALENVGATTAQETKIHDIVAATYTEIEKSGTNREAMRKQVLELIKAPTPDRAAIEKIRADKIAEMDAKSKTIVGAFLDAADQLSPDQRAKLAQNAEERMARGWGAWHHRDRMEGPDDRRQPGAEGKDDGDHG